MSAAPQIARVLSFSCTVAFGFVLFAARAVTVLSGNIAGTWTTNGSPYILTADCTVASNQMLTIQPGVEVILGPTVNLNVQGGISAIGTPDQLIRFHGVSPTNYWGSIAMTYSSSFTNRIRYCQIRDGNQALVLLVAGGNRTMSAEIFNCDFLNCSDSAINGTAIGYQSSVPSGFPSGPSTLAPEIHNCVFDNSEVKAGPGDACYFTAVFSSASSSLPPPDAFVNPRITGNLFKNLPKTVQQPGSALRLEVSFNTSEGNNASRPIFANNTVVRCDSGVAVSGYHFSSVFIPLVHNNIFANSIVGVYRNGSSDLDTKFNCFFGNIENFSGYPATYGVAIIPNNNGDPCDPFYNIMLDPKFLDPNSLLIANFSPCIDAGDPAVTDVCPQFSHGTGTSDIGAYGGPDACGWLTHGFAPVITGIPADQSSCVGGNAVFKLGALGSAPLDYRWYFNKSNVLTGATNVQLTLTKLQADQAGLYSVAASNSFGSVTSTPARLVISDACVGLNLYAGLSVTGIVGRTYVVDTSTNVAGPAWIPFATNTFATTRWLVIDTNTPVTPARFFRVRLLP